MRKSSAPTRVTLHSDEISCDGCLNAIRIELEGLEGVQSVKGKSKKREVTVKFAPPTTLYALNAAMDGIGYPVDATK